MSEELSKLPSLSIVLGFIAVKNMTTLDDQIRTLKRLGYGMLPILTITDCSIEQYRRIKRKEIKQE